MMGRRLPAKSGDEFDAITGWRRVIKCMSKAGIRSAIKRRMRRRERHRGPCLDHGKWVKFVEWDAKGKPVWLCADCLAPLQGEYNAR